MKVKKRVLAALLALVFCLSLAPMTVGAYDAKNIITSTTNNFTSMQVTNIVKDATGATITVTLAGPTNYQYHVGDFDTINGAGITGTSFDGTAIEGELANSGDNTVGIATPITFKVPVDMYKDSGVKIALAIANNVATDVDIYTFRLDKNGDWYEPKATMPTGADKYVGSAFTATIDLNAPAGTVAGDVFTELMTVPTGAVTVTLSGTPDQDITDDCTITYVKSDETGGPSITVEVPADKMVAANKDKTISIQLTATNLKDDANTAFTVSGTNPAEFTIKEGVPVNVEWAASDKFTDGNKNAVNAKYGDAKFTITAKPDDKGQAVTYSSSDATVATVDEDTGEVTILKAGTATITATSQPKDGQTGVIAGTATYTLTVTAADPIITVSGLNQSVSELKSAVEPIAELNPAATGATVTMKYGIPAITKSVVAATEAKCNCGAGDSEVTHAADCAHTADAGQHCDCGAGNAVAVGTHAANCPAVKSEPSTTTIEWKTAWADVQTYLGTVEGDSATVYVTAGSLAVTDKVNAITASTETTVANLDPGTVAEGKGSITEAGKDVLPMTITKQSAPSYSGGVSSDFTVTYSAGAHGTINGATSEKVKRNESPAKVPSVTANKGYAFIGWSLDGKTIVNPAAQTITKNTTFTALYGDHLAYMVGRSATEFVPNGNLTRAEAAAILSRLTEGFEEDGTYPAAPYSDLTAGAWYVKYVNFAADKGIVNGRDDGTFDPDANITRAEFATMIANFAKIAKVDTAAVSTDVAGHWAEGYIAALEQAKVVTGYEDGTFKPNANITRAEAATMVNGAIGRVPMSELDLAANGYVNPFVDVTTSQWFYAQVMEAGISHMSSHFHK